jgi:hypothetical protein
MNCSVAHKTVSPEGPSVSIFRMRSTGFMCIATKVDSSQKAQIQHKETQNLLRPYHHDIHLSLKIKYLQLKKVMESKVSVALRDALSGYRYYNKNSLMAVSTKVCITYLTTPVSENSANQFFKA